jgi:hypothetical protein
MVELSEFAGGQEADKTVPPSYTKQGRQQTSHADSKGAAAPVKRY